MLFMRYSPGLNNREWIETAGSPDLMACRAYSPGLNNREWIETSRLEDV